MTVVPATSSGRPAEASSGAQSDAFGIWSLSASGSHDVAGGVAVDVGLRPVGVRGAVVVAIGDSVAVRVDRGRGGHDLEDPVLGIERHRGGLGGERDLEVLARQRIDDHVARGARGGRDVDVDRHAEGRRVRLQLVHAQVELVPAPRIGGRPGPPVGRHGRSVDPLVEEPREAGAARRGFDLGLVARRVADPVLVVLVPVALCLEEGRVAHDVAEHVLDPRPLVIDGRPEEVRRVVDRRPPRGVVVPLHDVAVGDRPAGVLRPERLAVGREALVQPDVRPRAGRDRVAPPLVRQLVRDDPVAGMGTIGHGVADGRVRLVLHGAAEAELAHPVLLIHEGVFPELLSEVRDHRRRRGVAMTCALAKCEG